MTSKRPLPNNWVELFNRIFLLTIGTLIGSVSVIVFFIPAQIAPAGLSGIAVIIATVTDVSLGVGLLVFIGNIPILYLAFRMLGGLRTVVWTLYVVVLYSLSIDVLTPYFPAEGVSEDGLLNAIFAGIIGGIGGGLVLRAGGTFGGTSTLARIIQMKFGTPLSSTYLYTNILIVGAAGVFLGWESALFSLVALVVEGSASDYMLEGPSVIRTVVIITNKPREVADAILYQLDRGVTGWEVTGMYTGEVRHMLYIAVHRPQVTALQQIISDVDERALIIVGQGHVAYGSGFRRVRDGKPVSPNEPEAEMIDASPVS